MNETYTFHVIGSRRDLILAEAQLRADEFYGDEIGAIITSVDFDKIASSAYEATVTAEPKLVHGTDPQDPHSR